MMRPNPFLLLIGGLNFSVSDLYTNKQGRLTPRQKAQLEHQRLRDLELWTLGLIILLVSGAVLEMRLVVVTFGAACVISIMMAVWIRGEEDLRGQVQMVSGRLRFKAAAGLPFHPQYQLLIDSEEFRVSRQIKDAFDTNQRYRLYYTPGTHTIVSAEVAA